MNRIMALARIVLLNGLRGNALWGLCLFALVLELCGVLFMGFFGHDLGRVVSDFQFSVMWMAGMIFILFYAVQAVAWDDTHRSIDSILARPISRAEYVLGMMAGLFLLLLCFELLLGALAMGELAWAKSTIGETYFPIFSPIHFVEAWMGLQLMLLVFMAIVMLVSSVIRGAFPVMLVSLSYYLICSGLPVVRASLLPNPHHTGTGAQGLGSVLQTMGLLFPDFRSLDWKDAVLSHQHIETLIGMPVWLPTGLMLVYLSIILLLSCMIYQRRDIL